MDSKRKNTSWLMLLRIKADGPIKSTALLWGTFFLRGVLVAGKNKTEYSLKNFIAARLFWPSGVNVKDARTKSK